MKGNIIFIIYTLSYFVSIVNKISSFVIAILANMYTRRK